MAALRTNWDTATLPALRQSPRSSPKGNTGVSTLFHAAPAWVRGRKEDWRSEPATPGFLPVGKVQPICTILPAGRKMAKNSVDMTLGRVISLVGRAGAERGAPTG